LVFTVSDRHGGFVTELQQKQFKILDNNQAPKEIVNFEAQTGLPLRIGLLIDASNPVQDRFRAEQQAASDFFSHVIRPATDKGFVLGFDEVYDVTQDFTDDLSKLAKGIELIRPGSGTAMWDSVYYACRDKMMKERNTTPVRRALVLISAGDDKDSRVPLREAIEMALRAEVIVYAIGPNLTSTRDTGAVGNLHMLSVETGGRAFFPDRMADLKGVFSQIQEELRSQYSLAYKPRDFEANGQFHSILIVVDDPKLKVRARKGYYAPKR
jgi:VWFA-related protein